jgi:hypothetical protein
MHWSCWCKVHEFPSSMEEALRWRRSKPHTVHCRFPQKRYTTDIVLWDTLIYIALLDTNWCIRYTVICNSVYFHHCSCTSPTSMWLFNWMFVWSAKYISNWVLIWLCILVLWGKIEVKPNQIHKKFYVQAISKSLVWPIFIELHYNLFSGSWQIMVVGVNINKRNKRM